MLKKFLMLFTLSVFLFSSEVAYIKSLEGKVVIKRNNEDVLLSIGSKLQKNDLIQTYAKSSIGIIFDDGTILTLGENSIFKINDYVFEPLEKDFNFNVELLKGKSSFESGKIGKISPQSVRFKIPEGIIGIRGTKFFVEVKE